jgi:hypothetical protein
MDIAAAAAVAVEERTTAASINHLAINCDLYDDPCLPITGLTGSTHCTQTAATNPYLTKDF